MKVYVSVPMTGFDDLNRPAALEAKARLLVRGYEVVIPHDIKPFVEDPQYHDYLRADIATLMMCDAIYMCRGWQQSNGCTAELQAAREVAMGVMYEVEP